ncbi:MAG: nucleotide exchange factor GrpE [Bacteroidetes bacterium]|nr:nucleotide exchange factor GrpE [Bacteroidota bacterium]MCH7772578.1 nucleotide exchange factor GrpE [Bacteroidota bacterium]
MNMSKNKKVKKMKEVEIEDEKSNEEIIETSTEEKINQLETEVLEFKDKLLRKAAEFENYKRRTENDQMNLLTYAAESFIKKLLPVIDDFERSLQHIEDAQDIGAIKQGIKLIYDKLMKVFQEQGVKKIDSVGKHFDVEYHEALMQRADDSVESHTVLDELEKGYTYNDKVIRHAKVIVSEEKSSADEETENDEQNSN